MISIQNCVSLHKKNVENTLQILFSMGIVYKSISFYRLTMWIFINNSRFAISKRKKYDWLSNKRVWNHFWSHRTGTKFSSMNRSVGKFLIFRWASPFLVLMLIFIWNMFIVNSTSCMLCIVCNAHIVYSNNS